MWASESADVKCVKGLWEKISYTWVVKNIDSSFQESYYKRIESPDFTNKKGNHKWCLSSTLSTCVSTEFHYLNLSLIVNIKNPSDDVIEAKYTLSLRNSGDCVIKAISGEQSFTRENRSWEYDKCIQMPVLLSLIPDQVLKIHAEIFVNVNHLDMEDHILVMGSDFPEARLLNTVDKLLESSDLADVVFEVKEAKFKAHRLILSAMSPVFAAMFTHESIEKNSGVVKIVDFDDDVFGRFLRFVYSAKVDIPSVNVATELFRAAEKYDFPDLKLLCMKNISDNLNSSNVGSILLFAEACGAVDLKQIAMNYMSKNIEFFSNVELEVYKLLEKENPKLLTEFFVMAAKHLLVELDKKDAKK